MTPPSFVFFDAAWTLIQPSKPVGFQYAELAAEYGVNADPQRLKSAFPTAWKSAKATAAVDPKVPYGRTREESLGFWSVVVRRCFEIADSPAPEADEFYERLFERFATRQAWKLDPSYKDAMELLRHHNIPAGILSNFDMRLKPLLADLGIAGDFACVVLSAEVGEEKPHSAIFKAAERACGHSGTKVALIGDDQVNDVEGGHKAGWRTVAYGGEVASLAEGVRKLVDNR